MVAFVALLAVIIRNRSDVLGTVALVAAFLPFMTQTVLFEPAWWFAAGLFLSAGSRSEPG